MQLKNHVKAIKGEILVPGDKSVSHRAIMFASIAEGTSTIKGLLKSEDVLATIKAFLEMGIKIEEKDNVFIIEGKGFSGLSQAHKPLDLGNSGTSMRLLSGILATCPFKTVLTGDDSLSNRPMDRIVKPLRQMGLDIAGQGEKHYPPLVINGNTVLRPIHYQLPVASAQVKSALLFAALNTEGNSEIIEKQLTRSHTEEMIKQFGGKLTQKELQITISGIQKLKGSHVNVPGDISSAAFWMAAGLIVDNAHLRLKHVGINPTRTGIIDVIQKMNGKISISKSNNDNTADIVVESSDLVGTMIEGDIIPRLIDELPIIALLATQAKGQTIIRDAQELKVKESNRIALVTEILSSMGANIKATEDGMIINGKTNLHATTVDCKGDHRIGMMTVIASLIVDDGNIELVGHETIATSYPQFFEDLRSIIGE